MDIFTNSISDAVDLADAVHWSEQPPQSDRERLLFLAAHHCSLAAAADHLPSATGQRLKEIAEQGQSAPTPLTREITLETARRWQRETRRAAHERIIAQGGTLCVEFRAWLGYDPPTGTDPDGRHRFHTDVLLPSDTALLLEGRHQHADDAVLQDIVRAAIGESYFRAPRDGPMKIYFCDIDYIRFSFNDVPADIPAA